MVNTTMRITHDMILGTIVDGISYASKGNKTMAEICRQSARRKTDDGGYSWSVHIQRAYEQLVSGIRALDGARNGCGPEV